MAWRSSSDPFLHAEESGVFLGDLLALDPTSQSGMDPTAKIRGTPPSARQRHGFTSIGGKLYVHGGLDSQWGKWSSRDIGISSNVEYLNSSNRRFHLRWTLSYTFLR